MIPVGFSDISKQHITNALGKKSVRKIVVIESDDWGTIRMPSKGVYGSLEKQGLVIDGPYNRYDRLATSQDLSALFDVLSSYKDLHGNHPILTFNCLVANPDFARIRSSDYKQYFFEPFTDTLKKHPGCEKSFELWKEGIDRGLLRPQFHGREHLNVPAWLTALQKKDRDALLGFEQGFWGHIIQDKNSRRSTYLAAYDFNTPKESDYVSGAASEGVRLFEKIFGYRSRSFIAPKFVWSSAIEKTLSQYGATLIQSQRNQLIPVVCSSVYKTKFHYTGQKNSLGQTYMVRNAFFEPSSDPAQDWVGSCLKDISRAFCWKTPAIISSHRVNFIGSIVPENRENNLGLLKKLLDSILKKWPEVEFMSSDQLETIMPGKRR